MTCTNSLDGDACLDCKSLRYETESANCDCGSDYTYDSSKNDWVGYDLAFPMSDGYIDVPLNYTNFSSAINGTPISVRNRGIYFRGNQDSLDLNRYDTFIMYNWFTFQFWLKPVNTNDTRSIYQYVESI